MLTLPNCGGFAVFNFALHEGGCEMAEYLANAVWGAVILEREGELELRVVGDTTRKGKGLGQSASEHDIARECSVFVGIDGLVAPSCTDSECSGEVAASDDFRHEREHFFVCDVANRPIEANFKDFRNDLVREVSGDGEGSDGNGENPGPAVFDERRGGDRLEELDNLSMKLVTEDQENLLGSSFHSGREFDSKEKGKGRDVLES